MAQFVYHLRFPGQYHDLESGLSYNYFRDYDPAIGRYVQSDPSGPGGGVNTYAYANGAPVLYIDPLGLIAWKGTYASYTVTAPIGGFFDVYELVSECVNCRRASVRLHARGFAFGSGLPISGTGGSIELHDLNSGVDPLVSNGLYQRAGAGLAVGSGPGWGYVVAGGATSQPQLGYIAGVDASASWAIGQSKVVNVRWFACSP
jgi:RHS repeat-associated protein